MKDIFFPVWEEEINLLPSNIPAPPKNQEIKNGRVKNIWSLRDRVVHRESTMSVSYKLTPNLEILETCLEALTNLGIEGQLNKEMTGSIGNNFIITIDLAESWSKGVKDENDKVIVKQIINRNSYDGSSAWRVFLGYLHSYCSNGMINMSTEVEIKNVHRGITIRRLKESIDQMLKSDKLINYILQSRDSKSGEKYINTLKKIENISKKDLKQFTELFSFINLKEQPLSELYHSLTWFTTHIIGISSSKYLQYQKLINSLWS